MINEKMEYDSGVGGSVVLPENVQTFRYAANLKEEIKNLLDAIKNPTNTKLIFQTLPIRMRRRAMSHHPKRLPRRYRAIHKSQMSKAGKPTLSKRPSRKYRRKPNNLLKEYLRRQRKNIWLETHIWHAKRFHMISKWGYKLPYSSCDKTYRACYRATSEHCLLQDISYYGCIEINGVLEVIRETFMQLTSPKCGLGLCAKTYTSGKREGLIHLFRSNQYPRGALGKINFIWKPGENMKDRTVWIFIHPSVYGEILEEFIKAFNLVSCKTIKVPVDCEEIKSDMSKVDNETNSKKLTQLKFITKTFAYTRTPIYKNSNSNITLTELKDTINRFRLTGPLTQSVLTKTLKPKLITETEPDNWFKSAMKKQLNVDAHELQNEYWEISKSIKSPGELIPNVVWALNIEDPRLTRPTKRSKAVPENFAELDSKIFSEFPDNLCHSLIWDFNLRNSLAETMMSTSEYCAMRNKNCLVPGENCEFEKKLQPIPILLLQRPGSQHNQYKRLGYGSGWDIIIPSGYAMSMWLTFIMWGARPGGLREIESVQRELGQGDFLPDTISGQKEAGIKYVSLQNKYFKRPPNKRCNYTKFAISSPFKVPFQQLVKEWCLAEEKYYILRDREILRKILNSLQHGCTFPLVEKGCLIQISITMKSKGNPGEFAILCLPKFEDFKMNSENYKCFSRKPIYIEPLRKDKKENERKSLKLTHKNILKRLRRKRVREKRKKQKTSTVQVKIRSAGTANMVSTQFKKMCQLWIDENPETIRHQCNREVLGYLTQCDFSFIEATVSGIGFVTIEGLLKLQEITNKQKQNKMMLLVRGTKSRNYRFASFKINLYS